MLAKSIWWRFIDDPPNELKFEMPVGFLYELELLFLTSGHLNTWLIEVESFVTNLLSYPRLLELVKY